MIAFSAFRHDDILFGLSRQNAVSVAKERQIIILDDHTRLMYQIIILDHYVKSCYLGSPAKMHYLPRKSDRLS